MKESKIDLKQTLRTLRKTWRPLRLKNCSLIERF